MFPKNPTQFNIAQNNYFNFLRGKNIILVGPASYLIGKNKGKEIDNYDLIARMNFSVPTKEEMKIDLGSRTDVLYKRLRKITNRPGNFFPTKDEVISWKKDGVKWVICSGSKHNLNFAKINNILPWIEIGDINKKIREAAMSRALLIGLISAVHILKSQAKSLTITNCTFYTTGYFNTYRGLMGEEAENDTDREGYDIFPQLKFLNDLRKGDSRLIFDEYLEEIIKQSIDSGLFNLPVSREKIIKNNKKKSNQSRLKNAPLPSLKPKKKSEKYLWRNGSFLV